MTYDFSKIEDNLHFVPLWIKALMGIAVLPGVVLAGFNLFPAYSAAMTGLDDIAIMSIWDVDLMLTDTYLRRAGTFLAIVALLLGAAAIVDMFGDDQAKAGNGVSKFINTALTGAVVLPAMLLGLGAALLTFIFALLMGIPTFLVLIWDPIMVLILVGSLLLAVGAFVTAVFSMGNK